MIGLLHKLLLVLGLALPGVAIAGPSESNGDEPTPRNLERKSAQAQLSKEEREILKQLELLQNLDLLESLEVVKDLPLLGGEGVGK